MKTYGLVEVYPHAFFIPALDGGERLASLHGRFSFGETDPDIHWIGG